MAPNREPTPWGVWLDEVMHEGQAFKDFLARGFSKDTAIVCIVIGKMENAICELIDALEPPDREDWQR